MSISYDFSTDSNSSYGIFADGNTLAGALEQAATHATGTTAPMYIHETSPTQASRWLSDCYQYTMLF